MSKNKKIILAGTLLVAGVIAVAGTFAWFTDSDMVVNKMKLAKFDVKLTEEWVEENHQNLEPGATVDKVVRVTNNGTADAVVRVSLEEALKLFKTKVQEEDKEVIEPVNPTDAPVEPTEPTVSTEVEIFWGDEKISDTDEKRIALPGYSFPEGSETLEDNGITYYTTITSLKDGEIQCYVVKDDKYDGLIRYNPETKEVKYAYYEYAESQVEDNEKYFTPVINSENWTEKEGYYYYNEILKPGEVTEPLFEKVTVSGELPNRYIGSIYTLTPNMSAVQANKEAIDSEWADALGKIDDLIKVWGLENAPAQETTPDPAE